ncbi:MAG: thiamine diphosphokinase [Chloroflexaceae bacterium]|nr:thiamine diphosphokinase [Chloroflexaceae bacterium]NJO06870.1 thiamine diphosphokinase [Chloroflexaceae bacterium]
MHAVVIANAPDLDATPFIGLLRQADLIVAADGGANALHRVNIVPHVVIGDLDSLEQTTGQWLRHSAHRDAVDIRQLPREKDETDLQAALLLVAAAGATHLHLLGTTGGRLDHTLANITMLTMPELAGRQVRMLEPHQELFLIRADEQHTLKGNLHDTVSLLPLTMAVHGVTISGLYYPLTDATLYANHARGVSNILVQPEATITLHDGLLLVIHHFDGGVHQWQHYGA